MTAQEFKIKVLPFKHKMYRMAYSLLNNREESEDVVQDVFLKLWSRKEDLENYRSIEAWAVTVTKNQCLDQLKSLKHRMTDHSYEPQGAVLKTPHSEVENKDTLKNVNQIMNHLPEQQKLILHLRDVEEMEFDEIGKIMKMNINAIRVNLSRARKKVRDQLIKTHNYEYSGN